MKSPKRSTQPNSRPRAKKFRVLRYTKGMRSQIMKICKAHGIDILVHGASIKLKMDGYHDLVIEHFAPDQVSVSHSYLQNGDVMRDPEYVYRIDKNGHWYAVQMTQDNLGIFKQMVEFDADGNPEKYIKRLQHDSANFSDDWANNLDWQEWARDGVVSWSNDSYDTPHVYEPAPEVVEDDLLLHDPVPESDPIEEALALIESHSHLLPEIDIDPDEWVESVVEELNKLDIEIGTSTYFAIFLAPEIAPQTGAWIQLPCDEDELNKARLIVSNQGERDFRVSDFVASDSVHDLLSPLYGIHKFNKLAEEYDELSSDEHDELDMVLELGLTRDLTDLSGTLSGISKTCIGPSQEQYAIDQMEEMIDNSTIEDYFADFIRSNFSVSKFLADLDMNNTLYYQSNTRLWFIVTS